MTIYSFVLLINYMSGMMLHDFHVSVTKLEHDTESQALEISQRIFIDDLEQALTRFDTDHAYNISTTEDFTELNPLIEAYMLEHFVISVNEKQVTLDYLGSKVEGDVLICFIEVPKVKKLKSLSVKNTVLFELFADQINLVHVKTPEGNKSLKLDTKQPVDQLVY
ncbi:MULTISPECIES: DUF6702 family protein [Reichenbachiella]|uniref:Uncharacterized protein n=1 Tax=Reichenbachiella agariperforans TaxID=156994 RepID=A0A1M6QJV6_REIAG|nr:MULTISPECIES: DUF6702 family protein [Reichenbachiella]SHK20445.1 hypothetical protein SAMN04488028_103355 [Reichenbachiella agariperforans]